jgi:large subunit ribosomal protein L17
MFRNMARSLVTYERIRTTEPKAKEVRKVVDRLVTLALQNTLHARREAYRVLENHQLVKKLFDEIGPRFTGVPGGFTRVVKLGLPRPGDCAPLAVLEFTRAATGTAPEPKAKKAKPAPVSATAPAKVEPAAAPAPVETAAAPAVAEPAEEPKAE